MLLLLILKIHLTGLNSAEVGLLYKGYADTTDVLSLLIYLANKGYIQITETANRGFKIRKLKDYDGDNENEKLFMMGLFNSTKIYGRPVFKPVYSSSKTEVTDSDLYNNFYLTLNKIVKNLNSRTNKYKIFKPFSLEFRFIIALMILITFSLIYVKPTIELYTPGLLLFTLLFPIAGSINIYKNLTCIREKKWEKILFSVLSGLFIFLPFGFVIAPATFYNIMYLLIFIIGILCVSLLYLFYYIMPKRTSYGNEILEKIERIQKLFGNIRKIKTGSFNNSKSFIFL